jgi:hypothetical protein
MTKHDLADQLGSFVSEHGVEEAGKVMSRMLLGLAHVSKAEVIIFSDVMGKVVITPETVPLENVN